MSSSRGGEEEWRGVAKLVLHVIGVRPLSCCCSAQHFMPLSGSLLHLWKKSQLNDHGEHNVKALRDGWWCVQGEKECGSWQNDIFHETVLLPHG